MSRKPSLKIPFSKLKFALGQILEAEGYLGSVKKNDQIPAMVEVELKYNGNKPAITSIKRESTPGHRKYKKADDLPNILNGYGAAVVSTSQGLMSVKEAKKKGIGGEIICSVY